MCECGRACDVRRIINTMNSSKRISQNCVLFSLTALYPWSELLSRQPSSVGRERENRCERENAHKSEPVRERERESLKRVSVARPVWCCVMGTVRV